MKRVGNNNFFSLEEIASKFNMTQDEVALLFDRYNIKYISMGRLYYVLEGEFISLFQSNTKSINDAKEENKRRKYPITEKEILNATVELLSYRKEISIKELREYLKETMDLTEEDFQMNRNRCDTKFDQKVRNLVSHRTTNGLDRFCIYNEGCLILKED